MSNLLPVGPDGETEHGTWCLVGASGMEHKTLFLVKGIPGHINPTTLPDVTCTYLHWQRSHWTSREVLVLITCYYYFFFMRHLLCGSHWGLWGLTSCLLVSAGEGLAGVSSLMTPTMTHTWLHHHQSQDDVPVSALTQDWAVSHYREKWVPLTVCSLGRTHTQG